MSKRRYKKRTAGRAVPDSMTTLPVDRPIAVYYRQSTDAQIGNVSTTIQTVDMVEYLKQRGWRGENIIMIDMDGGISGSTKIDERPGMRRLFDLITEREIGAVACQDEDRLFRDVTQIQVNIFIEACRSSRVLVLTPSMVYDFANEQTGTFHARQFRFKSEMSAEFISSYLKGRLHPARMRVMREGRWAGATVPLGYMIDERKMLADGSQNENWRRYVPYLPHAEIVNEYFRLFLSFAGNLSATLRHIHSHGPYFSNPKAAVAPEGYRLSPPRTMRNYGKGFCPGKVGLAGMLSNAAYIGHWAVKGEIVRLNNHPAIVPEETFMRAFNYLSDVTLEGRPNSAYRPFHHATRPSLDTKRPVERPLCVGMIYTKVNSKWRKAGTNFVGRYKHYAYAVHSGPPFEDVVWWKKADYVDGAVANLLREKLMATFDPEVWEQTLASFQKNYSKQRQRKVAQLAALETVMQNQVASLDTLTSPDMIMAAELRYQEAQAEHARLSKQLSLADDEGKRLQSLHALKETCGPALENWPKLTLDEKRVVLHAFISRIVAAPLEEQALQLTVHWRDETTDEVLLPRQGTTYTQWLNSEEKRLLEMVDEGASQIEISAAFTHRKWEMIREKYFSIRGRGAPMISAQPIKDDETYKDYIERTRGDKVPYKARTGERWKPKDVDTLLDMLDLGATQLELAEAFPHRNWGRIRAKITQLRGGETDILGMGEVRKHETFPMYLMRKARETGAGEDSLSSMDSERRPGKAPLCGPG